MIKPFLSKLILFVALIFSSLNVKSQSLSDLDFLIGEWDVERIYRPDKEPRILKGTLVCERALDSTYLKCIYDIDRPDKVRGLDVVYFNYNSIYKEYESLWLSSTWPIKVLMRIDLLKDDKQKKLKTEAQFKIENDITEFVKDELVIQNENHNSFKRQTLIRTSDSKDDKWINHMVEKARRHN